MRPRSKLPALLLGSAIASLLGVGTVATAAGPGETPAASAGAHTGHTMAVSTQASADDPDGDGYIPADPRSPA